jgi:propanol-preferring alcohol dehydrogenase
MVLPAYGAPLEPMELPDPAPSAEGVVVAVAAAGVCHSDLHLIDGVAPILPSFPWVLGHEIVGTVAAVGPQVQSVAVGDAVAVFGGWGCGACRLCRAGEEQLCGIERWAGIGAFGGYADYVSVPAERHLVPLGDLDPVAAVPLTDAGLTSYRAVRKSVDVLGPDSFLVSVGVGGLGQFGLTYARLLTAAATIAVDVSAAKRDTALALGAIAAVDPSQPDAVEEIRALTHGEGAAAVIDYVGSQDTLTLAGRVVGRGGHIVVVGIGGGVVPVSFGSPASEVSATSSHWGNRAELNEVVALARRENVSIATQPYDLADANRALSDLRDGRVAGRAVLLPAGAPS